MSLLLLFGGAGGGPPPSTEFVSVTMNIEIGFHASSFRDTLIDQEFTQGVWALAETRSAKVRDISGNGHHGAYVGTGFTKGIPLGLPEGGLGTDFDGNGHVLIPDDGNVFGGLSMAAGSMDIVFFVKTTHNSATDRVIVVKRNAGSTNGYYVGLVSGAIRFRLDVGGVTIFNITRGSIADGSWHLVHCYYDPPTMEARVFVDGAQAGATQSTTNTDPPYVAVDLGIAGGDAAVTAGFIGTLAYVHVGREGDLNLSSILQGFRDWTTVLPDVRSVLPVALRYGIDGNTPLDNTARTGECIIGLDNSVNNSGGELGFYTFTHPECRAGFRRGSPLRVTFSYDGTTYIKHVGRIASAVASSGKTLDRLTRVTSVDWIDIAASSRLSELQAQANIRSDDVIGLAIDEAQRPPHAIALSTGDEVFPIALASGNGRYESILSEASRTATSERGYFYVKGDTQYGGVVCFEDRATRQINISALATLTDNELLALEPDDSIKPTMLLVTVHPATVDGSPTSVLFEMQSRQQISPGETAEILVSYTDQNERSVGLGGIDMATPVATTDYTMNTAEDGTGADLTASVAIRETGADLGGSSALLHVTNNHATAIGWFKTRIVGKAIRTQDPVTVPVFEDAIVRRDGPTEQEIDLPYVSSREFAIGVGQYVSGLYDGQRIRSVSFVANRSALLMTQALQREPGDRIDIVETMQSGSLERPYIINNVEFQVTQAIFGPLIRCTWTVSPAATETGVVWLLGSSGFSELGETTVLGL